MTRSAMSVQNVASEGGEIHGWNDLQEDWHRMTYRQNSPQSTIGASGTIMTEAITGGNEPAGGLARDEVAELVALTVTQMVQTADETTGTNDQHVRHLAEISLDDTMRYHDNSIGEENFTSLSRDSGSGGNDTTDASPTPVSRYRKSVGEGTLWGGMADYRCGFEDQTNGTGAGANASQSTFVFHENYRQSYGQGPILLGEDEFYVHRGLNFVGWDDTNVATDLQFRMVWDVFELEETPVRFR